MVVTWAQITMEIFFPFIGLGLWGKVEASFVNICTMCTIECKVLLLLFYFYFFLKKLSYH
jgi:hypothetical protein